jgi:hypothetical protein
MTTAVLSVVGCCMLVMMMPISPERKRYLQLSASALSNSTRFDQDLICTPLKIFF